MEQFDVKEATERIIRFIRDFFETSGGKYAVIGLSGGKDSTIVAALCARALGQENVVGVIMPDGGMRDYKQAARASKLYCGTLWVMDIDRLTGVFRDFFWGAPDPTEQAMVNLPARLRMTCLYYVAQCTEHGRVANTCNLSENWVGYATRYGDGAGDFAPLHECTVQEVKAIGHYLGVPSELVEKVPDDGLCGKTDEENLGFTYEVLDRYIREGVCEDPGTKARIDELHGRNLFKLLPMPAADIGMMTYLNRPSGGSGE